MKKSIFQAVFKGICFIVLTLTVLSLNAQPFKYAHLSEDEKEQKSLELINEAEFMVRGDVKEAKYFYGTDGETIYTEVTVEVTHWYKGSGRQTISLIKKGGAIGLDNQFEEHDPSPYIPVGKDYIFLLKKGEKKGTYQFIREEDRTAVAQKTSKSYLVGFYSLIFKYETDFVKFISNAKGINTSVKKKVKEDAGFSKKMIEITSISPSTLRAGVGDILTITGSGFGNMRGEVLFRNGDDPALEDGTPVYLGGLDALYLHPSKGGLWTDGEIRVVVPSNVLAGGSDNNTAGSGHIRLRLADGTETDESHQTDQTLLTIEYALKNEGRHALNQQSGYPMQHILIGREHCLNGYVFTFHDSFEGNTSTLIEARATIEAALDAWANRLNITLELEKNESDNYVYVDFKEDALMHRTVISFDNNVPVIRTGTRPQWDEDCGSDCFPNEVRYHGGFIKVNPEIPWQYDRTGDIDEFQSDFYTEMLHELGHYLGVDHDILLNADGSINYNNLMSNGHRFPNMGETFPESSRITLENYNTRAVDAADIIIDASKIHDWTDDFSNDHGIETLSNVNSAVQPTPTVNAQLWWILTNNNGEHLYRLTPQPFNSDNDYYWLGGVTADGRWKWACGGLRPSTHYVRVKNDACTVSSLYSLPKTIGETCLGLGRDDDSVPTNQPLISIYPNPTKGRLNVQFETLEGVEIPAEIDSYIGIYDNLGRLQHQHRVSDATLRQTTIDISTLPAGMYWVVWFAAGEVIDTQQVQKTE